MGESEGVMLWFMRGQVKMERKTKQSTVITLLEVFIKAMLFESWFHNSICEKKTIVHKHETFIDKNG